MRPPGRDFRVRCRRLATALAFLAASAGCTASPPPRIYLLAPRGGQANESVAATVALKGVDIPAYLDRPQFVRLSEPYELQVAELERWGEGMHEMVSRVLASDLAQRLPKSQVISAGGPLSATADVVVEVDLRRFDADPDGTIVLEGQWVLRRGDALRQVRSALIRVQPDGATTPALVAAMSDALARLADQIAASMTESPKRKASARSFGRDGTSTVTRSDNAPPR